MILKMVKKLNTMLKHNSPNLGNIKSKRNLNPVAIKAIEK
jgi:hypothetical protein